MKRIPHDFRDATRWILAGMGLVTVLTSAAAWAGPTTGLIAVSPDGTSFVEQSSGRLYVPFGVNYYDPNTGWAPKIWRQFDTGRVTRHFEVMRELGVNCARVFLTAATFQPDVSTIDEQALAKLDTLVRIARQSGIRLILTGPDHWEGSPAYWKPDRFAGEQALKALENFWRTLGKALSRRAGDLRLGFAQRAAPAVVRGDVATAVESMAPGSVRDVGSAQVRLGGRDQGR